MNDSLSVDIHERLGEISAMILSFKEQSQNAVNHAHDLQTRLDICIEALEQIAAYPGPAVNTKRDIARSALEQVSQE